MTPDTIERFGASILQHGPDNDRVYLMHVDPGDLPDLLRRAEALAAEHGYSKIFGKVPASEEAHFLDRGFVAEARIGAADHSGPAIVFVSRFVDPQRQQDPHHEECARILRQAQRAAGKELAPLPTLYALREASPDDADLVASLYRQVFPSYPFPIHDPAWLRQVLDTHVRIFTAWEGERPVAASAAEIDREWGIVEMTDFATQPAHRARGLAGHLLAFMEEAMTAQRLRTAYTIARALSPGMNITFARAGYRFGGTLVNNTQISGSIQSMNVWYRDLDNGSRP
jgi:putative beta-lysine N-acetyltransferase